MSTPLSEQGDSLHQVVLAIMGDGYIRDDLAEYLFPEIETVIIKMHPQLAAFPSPHDWVVQIDYLYGPKIGRKTISDDKLINWYCNRKLWKFLNGRL